MYSYCWDAQTGGLLLNSSPAQFSKEPRPVYYQELDMLGFDKFWKYEKNDAYPYMWAESNNYYYRGKLVAKTSGGSLINQPEVILLEEPESNNQPLRFIDIDKMVEKNHGLMENLIQDTIKKIYNTYNQYIKKVDVFYVAFSGGKDSVVVLDLVQKSLPHNAFEVYFADTDMEFPTTRELMQDISIFCKNNGISFYTAKSEISSLKSWDIFGPPARKIRWCCTVHKTAPVINLLCEVHNINKIHSMMITGVRGEESPSRSEYDELSMGKKLPGQYSFHPLLEWSSAEIYLYIYSCNLLLNNAYKYGFNRVGCIMCPNSSEKHEYIKKNWFPKLVNLYTDKIIHNTSKDLSGNNKKYFLDIGIWKNRLSGRELLLTEDDRFSYEEDKNYHVFKVKNLKEDWKIWYKTLGDLLEKNESEYLLEYSGIIRKCYIKKNQDESIFQIENLGNTKNAIEFISYFRSILAKTQYCVQCKTCVAECPNRNISMENGILKISNNCIKCHMCLKIKNGCLLYNSLKGSNDMKSLKGVNRYFSVGVESNWIKEYLKNQNFEPGNKKTDAMFCFMNDAGLTSKKKITDFGKFIQEKGLDLSKYWALLLCNLVYSPAFGWFVKNIPFNEEYIESRLLKDMEDDPSLKDGGKKARGEFWNGFKTILDTNEAFKEIGFGIPEIKSKTNKNGEEKKSMLAIKRTAWLNPEPLIILYSLYKFAEACGDYCQFTLTRLLDNSIESDGISPTQIFGLNRETMIKLLNGLAVNYPDFITVQFTLDLDTITLNSEKSSSDVINLF